MHKSVLTFLLLFALTLITTAAQAQDQGDRKFPVHSSTTLSNGCSYHMDGWFDDGYYQNPYSGVVTEGPQHHHIVFTPSGNGPYANCPGFTADLKVAPAGKAGDDGTDSGVTIVEGTLRHDDTGETEDVASSPELRSMLSKLISQYYE